MKAFLSSLFFVSSFAVLSATASDKRDEPEIVVDRLTGCTVVTHGPGKRVFRCPEALSLSDKAARAPFVDELKRLAGNGPEECGLIGLGDAAEGAIECALQAQANGNSFWVAFQKQGIDSEIWTGAARVGDSLVILNYDSNVGGQPEIEPHFSRYVCEKLRFDVDHVLMIACAK